MNFGELQNFESRSISAENLTGEKGKGGMSESGTGSEYAKNLGIGWKISPSVIIVPGDTFELAKINGSGIITHIWLTDDCPQNRMLIIRIYWDESDSPSVEVPLGDFLLPQKIKILLSLHHFPCV